MSVRRRSSYGAYLARGRIRDGCFDPACPDCTVFDDLLAVPAYGCYPGLHNRPPTDTYRRVVMRHRMRTATAPLSTRMKGKIR